MSSKTESIAAGLRGARSATKETQREIAECVGAVPSTVCSWERTGCIGFEDAWKLADHYGLTLDELAGRSCATATAAAVNAAQSAAASTYAEVDRFAGAVQHAAAPLLAPAV